MKAVVLAAGLGTRLRPLTCIAPKPLLPVWGEPMLARIVSMLRERGVDDIAVNCHYLHGQVEKWCAENGCRASYEPEILGTGGVLNPLREWIGDEDFYLVNGDTVMENAPKLELPDDPNVIAVAATTVTGPRTIEVEPSSGFVTNWKSDDAGIDGTFTYCGFALLRAKILDYVEKTGFSSIVDAYEKAMMDGRFVKAVGGEDFLWTDAGTIDSYIAVNRDGDDNAFNAIPQLAEVAGADGKIEFLGARGSERVFFRSDSGVIVIYDDSKRAENAKYASHARWLKAQGVEVPSVIADRPELKTLVLEWAGVERKMKLEEYVKVVEALARFNALDARGLDLEREFDADLYAWERELFARHYLGDRCRMEMPAAVEKELIAVAERLIKEPKALVHRDFQSTNVLWRNDRLTIIDFQGMRLGPAVYDLASLVYDPYVKFSEGERRALVKLYAKKCGRDDIAEILPYAAVERLVQCLGAYGRLASVGQGRFLEFIVPALENLLAAADEAGLEAVGALAEDLIAKESHAAGHHHHSGCGCDHHHHQ